MNLSLLYVPACVCERVMVLIQCLCWLIEEDTLPCSCIEREIFCVLHTLVLGFVIASGRLKYSNLFGQCISEEVEVIFLGFLLLQCVFLFRRSLFNII